MTTLLPRLLTAADVADRLAVDMSTVRRMTRRRELPAMNIGTERRPAWRYEAAEIEKWLAARRRL